MGEFGGTQVDWGQIGFLVATPCRSFFFEVALPLELYVRFKAVDYVGDTGGE